MGTPRKTASKTLPILLFWSIVFHNAIHPVAPTPVVLPTDEHGDYNGSDLIEWIRSHPDGVVHPSLRIGRERPGDPTSLMGLFVSSTSPAIEEGEIIARLPWDRMIHPDAEYGMYKFTSCQSIHNLARELRLGNDSEHAPYVRYLSTQPRGMMPGEWSPAATKFLALVLGNDDLPPYQQRWLTRFDDDWVKDCGGNPNDEHERMAFWLAASRDEDTLMVPVYDLANHSNDPALLNTKSHKPEKAGESFEFVASRKILPGEQVYNSYNRCNTCADFKEEECESFSYFRTPDLFAGFGFVEDYPQNWSFAPDEDDESSDDDDNWFEFCLERDSESGEVEAVWEEDEMPSEEDARWLRGQLARLKGLQGSKATLEKHLVQGEEGGEDKEENEERMTRYEWESIWRYHKALSRAITAAILSVNDGSDEL